MLHFRVICPASQTSDLVDQLVLARGVHSLTTRPGAARKPDGDLIEFDAAIEAGNTTINLLRSRNIDHVGSIAISRIDTALSDAAARAELEAPGDPSEAVIWEEVEARVRNESGLSASFIAMLTVATLIAGVAILTDSPVLVVGAMVVGPEYGPLASIALGLHRKRKHRIVRGLRTLCISFPIAIAATYAMTIAIRFAHHTPKTYELGNRPLTAFISRPDVFSLIVAILAGVAGTLALTQSKASTLIGVLVSVTTVPAAANVGVALAHQRGHEAIGASAQLLLNLVTIAIVGAITLWIQLHHTNRLRDRSGI